MTTLLQLEAFVAVVDMGGFDAAARRLGIAQSAISRHIQAFEGRFPFELFDRRGRSARLTLNGAEVLAQVRTVLRRRDELVERLGRKESLRRNLRLGVTELAAFTWLPVFAESVRRAYPMVRLDIQVGLGGRLHELLRQGQLDLVMVPNAFPSAELQRLPLALVRNGWYCARSVAQGAKRLSLADLPRFTLLAPGADSAAALLMNDWFRKHGIVPAGVLTCDSLAALAGMAAAGLGIARLPSAVAGELVARGVIREVEITPAAPRTPYVTLVRRDAVTPFYRAIAKLAREQCDYDTRFQDWHEKHAA